MHKASFNEADTVTHLMLREVSHTVVLSREEEQALFRKYKDTTSKVIKNGIRNKLVQANLRFVLKIALHYNRMIGVDVNELMTEGKIGLFIAVDKYDYNTGNKFISFAVWWIRCQISKYLESNDLIKLPAHQKLRLNRIRREDYDSLSDDDKLLIELTASHTSFDSPINGSGEDDLYLQDIIEDKSIGTGEQDWINSRISTDLLNIVEKILTSEEQVIIKGLFGLNGSGESITLQETNEIIGKSRERIRQIRNRALEKLKRNLDVQELNEMLYEVNR